MEPKNPIYVTREGYKQYELTLREYEAKYAEAIKNRGELRPLSSDNFKEGAFDIEARVIAGNIRECRETMQRLVIIEDENAEENTINMNDIVQIQMFHHESEIKRVQIVGGMPDFNRKDGINSITINSPLGKAIYKSKIGEVVSYKVNKNEFSALIISKENGLEKEPEQNQPM